MNARVMSCLESMCLCKRGVHSLVADDGVELENGIVLLGGERPALDVRAQVVGPPEPAALAAPVQPCMHAHRIASSAQIPRELNEPKQPDHACTNSSGWMG
jgi:hypothetical protein